MKVGVIGIGNMGLGMALRLRDGGHAVAVRDIAPAREALASGCDIAPSPAAAASGRELVIVAVVDALQTEAVLFGDDGVTTSPRHPACVMLCPTIGASDTERIAQRLSDAGIEAIDAPMSGGPLRARDGSMSLMVACSDDVFERWQPLLAWLSSRLFRVGTRPGDGARTKLVNNLLAAVNLAGAAEALALATRLGLDPEATLSVIEQSSGQSWIGSERLRRALAGQTEPLAHMTLLAKDSRLALAEAAAAGFDTPVGAVAQAVFARAVDAGLADADDGALYRWQAG